MARKDRRCPKCGKTRWPLLLCGAIGGGELSVNGTSGLPGKPCGICYLCHSQSCLMDHEFDSGFVNTRDI